MCTLLVAVLLLITFCLLLVYILGLHQKHKLALEVGKTISYDYNEHYCVLIIIACNIVSIAV